MTKNVLEEYLFQIIRNEQRKYELQKIKEVAYSKKKALESEKFLAYETQAEEIKTYIHVKIINILKDIGLVIGFAGMLWGLCWFIGGVLGEVLVSLKCPDNKIDTVLFWLNRIRDCIILVFIWCTISDVKKNRYLYVDRMSRREAEEKKQELENTNNQIQAYNDNLKHRKEQIIPIYNKEYKCLGEEYIQVEKNLEQLYGLNIIFPKYRNMTAVCSLYEYISSGRCDTLEGQAGAYHSQITAQNIEFMKWFNVFSERRKTNV